MGLVVTCWAAWALTSVSAVSAQPTAGRASAADQPSRVADVSIDTAATDHQALHASPSNLANGYAAAGAQVTVRGDLIAVRLSLANAFSAASRLRMACANLAKAEVKLPPKLERSAIFIRAEEDNSVVGMPLASDKRGQYFFSWIKEDLRPVPEKAAALDMLPLVDLAFAELADVIPDTFVRPTKDYKAPKLLPSAECILMEPRPKDEVLGFAAVPLFVADMRCAPSRAAGSATPCYVVVVGRGQVEKETHAILSRVGAQESAKVARREEEARRAKAEEQQQRSAQEEQRVEAARREVTGFRKSLKDGIETNCGPVLEMKGPLVKVYFAVKDFGNEHWLRADTVFPPRYGCTFVNGKYLPPSP